MNAEKFIRSLLPLLSSQSGREEAAAQVEGAIRYDGIGATLATEERQRLVSARVAMLAGKRPG